MAVGTAETGPPPLARRERSGGRRAHRPPRTTSARAERTTRGRARAWGATDHLRWRGENWCSGSWAWPWRGPPPLARRERRGGLPSMTWGRTTSARAERTGQRDHVSRARTDHLRSRGENAPALCSPTRPGGPPPLARREQQPHPHGERPERTTSARAERTAAWRSDRRRSPDHLRSRGENEPAVVDSLAVIGPPPLARRELRGKLPPGRCQRTTSARAERTVSPRRCRGRPADHLRSRGENTVSHTRTPLRHGPPPLARREL